MLGFGKSGLALTALSCRSADTRVLRVDLPWICVDVRSVVVLGAVIDRDEEWD